MFAAGVTYGGHWYCAAAVTTGTTAIHYVAGSIHIAVIIARYIIYCSVVR